MNGARRNHVLGGFEGELTFLGNADEHHAFGGSKATPIACRNIVFALAALELNDRHQVLLGKGRDGLHEPIMQRTKGRR